MAKGWVNEFERHSLARQGIKTAVPKAKKSYFVKESFGLPRELQPVNKFYTKEEEKKTLSEDFFKFDSRQTTREQLAMLREIIKKYSDNASVHEVGNHLYVHVKNISSYPEYIKEISNYGYYNGLDKVTKKSYLNKVSDYDERNDLLD